MELPGIRYTKTEINKIRESNRIVAEVHKELKGMLVAGIATSQIDKEAFKIIKSFGGEPAFKGYRGFPFTTCISVNDTIVHGFPSKHSLKEKDLVSVDVGVVKDGYYGDACFSVVIGNNEKAQRLVDATHGCLESVITTIRDGVTTGDIGEFIESYGTQYGYGVVKDFVGHSIGCVLHDNPPIKNYGRSRFGFVLKADMVICIEPMFIEGSAEHIKEKNGWEIKTKDGGLAAHAEHCVLITNSGYEILSQLP